MWEERRVFHGLWLTTCTCLVVPFFFFAFGWMFRQANPNRSFHLTENFTYNMQAKFPLAHFNGDLCRRCWGSLKRVSFVHWGCASHHIIEFSHSSRVEKTKVCLILTIHHFLVIVLGMCVFPMLLESYVFHPCVFS